jgi:hypothetical protein
MISRFSHEKWFTECILSSNWISLALGAVSWRQRCIHISTDDQHQPWNALFLSFIAQKGFRMPKFEQ